MTQIIITKRDPCQHESLDDFITRRDDNHPMTLGQKIKFARECKGLSQPELARNCGWQSQSRISQYEKNKREPKLSDLRKIANSLGRPIGWFIENEVETDTVAGVTEATNILYERTKTDLTAIEGRSSRLPSDALKFLDEFIDAFDHGMINDERIAIFRMLLDQLASTNQP